MYFSYVENRFSNSKFIVYFTITFSDVATTIGSRCVFPFTYKGTTFNTCASAATSASSHPKLWCATGVDAEGNYDGNWANCGECMSGRAGQYFEISV